MRGNRSIIAFRKLLFSRALFVLVLACSLTFVGVSGALAAEPKGARIETYIAKVNKLVDKETKSGKAVPAYSNTAKLPLMVFPKAMEGTERVEFRIDVSGVEKLYIGTGERWTLRGVTLDSGDGVKKSLRAKDGKTLVKVAVSDKRRFRWHRGPGDFYLQQCETSLQLDGKYKWISGKLDAFRGMTWMSSTSNVSKLNAWTRMRGPRQSAAQHAGFDRRKDTPMMASGYVRITIADAVEAITDFTMGRYGKKNQVDPAIIAAIQKAAKSAKTGADYDDVRSLCFAAINYREFENLRKRVQETKDFPGLSKKFDATIARDYALLNPAKFDYSTDFPKQQKVWDSLLKEVKTVNAYPALITETIKKFSRTAPSEAELAKQEAVRQNRLTAASNDVDKYLAVYAELKAERLKFLSSQTALDFDSILINRNPPPGYSHNGDQHLGRHSRLGKGLTILTGWKSGKPKVKTILEGKMPPGSYRNPDLSYDGKRVLFAFCDHTEEDKKLRRFFIYEAAIDGSWVRQLTGTKRDKFQTWDNRATVLIEDNDPCYLPDGDIMFVSTRCQSYGRCHGGRYNPAWTLYRMKADGSGIRQVSFNNENEYEPAVLNDGRIVFTRWEYTFRHEMFFHMLWWCRPDGTEVSNFYGADTLHPMMVVEATPIPGSHKIVATAQGHHSYNTGTTIVINPRLGENGEKPVTRITTETPYSESPGSGWPKPHWSHPYPVNEELFFVSRANHRVYKQGMLPPLNNRAIYLVDSFGGREFIYEDPKIASFSPIPIRKRKRPPVLPSRAMPGQEHGTLFVQNVYLTRNDPDGVIKPGMIKAIRLNALGVQGRAMRSGLSPTNYSVLPKKVLGTVPVGPDGSAFFKAPANTALQLQILDKNGMAILTEKSFFYLQPGENRSCVGCHEPAGTAPIAGSVAKMARSKPMDVTPPAGPDYPGGNSFYRSVQPVLDRYCIKCHGLEKKEKDINFINDGPVEPKGLPRWYRSHQRRVQSEGIIVFANHGNHQAGYKPYMAGKDKDKRDWNVSVPRRFFAYTNTIAQMLAGNEELAGKKYFAAHKNIKMDADSYMRIIEWLDLNCQACGDLFPNKVEERTLDATKMAVVKAYARELFGARFAAGSDYALVNPVQPDESRVLMAPLSIAKGGWGQFKGYSSKDDAKFKKMASLAAAAIVRLPNENTRGWFPTLKMGGADKWVLEDRVLFYETLGREFEDK